LKRLPKKRRLGRKALIKKEQQHKLENITEKKRESTERDRKKEKGPLAKTSVEGRSSCSEQQAKKTEEGRKSEGRKPRGSRGRKGKLSQKGGKCA